ncbi:MAG: 1,2-phenylacetyl-CoA epoxidase subunit PaaC, partial [Halieaceae bacterium]
DFAFTIARQFLYDSYALLFMEQLKASKDARLAAIGAKAEKESTYHVRRGREWMLRLGGGTEESHAKLQRAVDDLWGYTDEIFEVDTVTAGLIADGVAVDPTLLRQEWHAAVSRVMAEADLSQPSPGWSVEGGRRGIHTDDLGFLLAELQFMQRAYPGLQW